MTKSELERLRGSKQWLRDEGRRVVAAWRRSGESMTAFGGRYGINADRIAWWRDRLAESTPAPTSTPTLVPMTLRASVTTSSPALSLIVGDVRIEVGDATRVAPTWFAAFVDALSRRT